MNMLATRAPAGSCLALGRVSTTGAMPPKCSNFLGQRMIWKAPFTAGVQQQNRDRSAHIPVQASFFGVGAPEALLVGVVALLLFGPKGLAQAVKTLGDTVKTFAPTIREITEVSTELKSTLEENIGLNDLREELQRPATPRPRPAAAAAAAALEDVAESSSAATESLSDLSSGMQQVDDVMAKAVDPEIERRRAESAKLAWGGPSPSAAPEAAPSLANLSLDELEKELARRKAATSQE